MAEVWRRSNHQISLYSGVELVVDEAVGLNGFCEFLEADRILGVLLHCCGVNPD